MFNVSLPQRADSSYSGASSPVSFQMFNFGRTNSSEFVLHWRCDLRCMFLCRELWTRRSCAKTATLLTYWQRLTRHPLCWLHPVFFRRPYPLMDRIRTLVFQITLFRYHGRPEVRVEHTHTQSRDRMQFSEAFCLFSTSLREYWKIALK